MLIAILRMVYLLSLEERSRPINEILYFLYSEGYSVLPDLFPMKIGGGGIGIEEFLGMNSEQFISLFSSN
jgi:hypothetical protein